MSSKWITLFPLYHLMVCVCVHACVCVCVCVCVCMCVCVCVCVCVCGCVCVCVCVCVCMHACMCVHECMRACICVHACVVCVCVYVHELCLRLKSIKQALSKNNPEIFDQLTYRGSSVGCQNNAANIDPNISDTVYVSE